MRGRVGGANRDRTDDLLDANQTLSQLSYGPVYRGQSLVGLVRLELTTYRLSSDCSNQLSYRPSSRCLRFVQVTCVGNSRQHVCWTRFS